MSEITLPTSLFLEPVAVAVHGGLCSLDGQIFNSFCFQCSLLQVKSTFLLKIQNFLREMFVSGLTACQISTSVFEPFLNVGPTIPSCFSHYSLPGEPHNIPLPLLCGWDNAASSDTTSSSPVVCPRGHWPPRRLIHTWIYAWLCTTAVLPGVEAVWSCFPAEA